MEEVIPVTQCDISCLHSVLLHATTSLCPYVSLILLPFSSQSEQQVTDAPSLLPVHRQLSRGLHLLSRSFSLDRMHSPCALKDVCPARWRNLNMVGLRLKASLPSLVNGFSCQSRSIKLLWDVAHVYFDGLSWWRLISCGWLITTNLIPKVFSESKSWIIWWNAFVPVFFLLA